MTGFSMQAAEIASVLGSSLTGKNARVDGVSTDTRSIEQGNLFIALKGENFDGNEYAAQAMSKGAACCVVSKPIVEAEPRIEVDDTRIALGQLGSYWRKSLNTPLVAVTGSNGKTTVKEMLASILGQTGSILATRGNFNNDIGMPLTLLRLSPEDNYAVIEMGANHPGEIQYLTKLAIPDVALINNAGRAHLEGFGTLEGVARAKGEIYSGLKEDGIAIINQDDQFAEYWKSITSNYRVITFGMQGKADISATYKITSEGRLMQVKTPEGEVEILIQLMGKHNVMNALASIAVCTALNINLSLIKSGIEKMLPVKGRLQQLVTGKGAVVINDTYNANPDSFHAAIDVLQEMQGKRYLVMGDMGELGETAATQHKSVASYAREMGIDGIYAVGQHASEISGAYGEGAVTFQDKDKLIKALELINNKGTTFLVKGSRSAKMENVVDALVNSTDSTPGGDN